MGNSSVTFIFDFYSNFLQCHVFICGQVNRLVHDTCKKKEKEDLVVLPRRLECRLSAMRFSNWANVHDRG
jgi:hypothetical protein